MIDLTEEAKARVLERSPIFTRKTLEDRIATPEIQQYLRAMAVKLVGSEEALKEIEDQGATVEVDLDWGSTGR